MKSRAYGAVSSGRKCRARLSHSKESSARRRPACRRIHSPFQSAERSSERIKSSATGHPPHNKKATPPKRRAATSIYQKEPIQRQTVIPAKWSRSEATATGIEPNRGPVVREPRGGQIYKVDREFRTSRRALNVLSVRVRTVRAGDQTPRPTPASAQGPVAYRCEIISSILPSSSILSTVLGASRWLPLWTGSPQTVPSPSMTDRHMKGQR